MSFEVDWRAVGEESKSGDCITFRFGDFLSNPDDQKVVVIDGGFRDTGEELVKFINDVYGTNTVDLVISTHPDNDHISGLNVVLEEMEVKELWMHKPWEREGDIKEFLSGGKTTNRELSEAVRKSLTSANELYKLAVKKETPVFEPFEGRQAFDGVITIVGPSEDFYIQTLSEIGSPTVIQSIMGAAGSLVGGAVEKVLTWFDENWGIELLTEPDEKATSPRNNSSVITLVRFPEKTFLFTSDAGVTALDPAIQYIESLGLTVNTDIGYVQVPHHGSKRNVGPAILNKLYGLKIGESDVRAGKYGVISCAKKGEPKHPNARVVNALNRRGVKVIKTAGASICSSSDGAGEREGWGPVTPVGFISRFQDDE